MSVANVEFEVSGVVTVIECVPVTLDISRYVSEVAQWSQDEPFTVRQDSATTWTAVAKNLGESVRVRVVEQSDPQTVTAEVVTP